MHTTIAFIIVTVLLSGCASSSTISDFDNYERRPLVKASIMPSKAQLSRDRARVVVLDIDDDSIDLAKQSRLGVALRQKIESLLGGGGVDVIDRKLAATLQNEIMLAEMKGKYDYKGPEVADFGVTGNVIAVNYSTSYSKASTWVDKEGESHYSPPRCSYSIQFEGDLKVHALPSLRLVDTIKLDETERQSVSLEGRYSRSCPKYPNEQLRGLVTEAGISAVSEAEVDLKNNFAPQGYITEARSNDDDHIFKVTMGRQAGLEEGQSVDIIQFYNNQDLLTGETSIEETKLVNAVVSNNVGSEYAWIVVDDAEKSDRIRLGDAVKVRYEDGWFQKLKKVF